MKSIFFSLILVIVTILGWQYYEYITRPTTTAEDVFKSYVHNYQQNNYSGMYAFVDQKELKEKGFTKDTFIQKYEAILGGIEASHIEIVNKRLTFNKDNDHYEGVFKAIISTFLGNVTATYSATITQKEIDGKNRWVVNWNPSLIFPQMDYGDKISAQAIIPERGEILDRDGIPLGRNGSVYELGIIPRELGKKREENIKKISNYFNVSTETINLALKQKWVKPDLFVPITILPDNFNPSYYMEDIPGVSFGTRNIRRYPLGDSAAHLIGYVKKVTKEDLDQDEEGYYSASDWIGKAGLEATFEKQLRGSKGGFIKVIDESGNSKSIIKQKEAINGEDIRLTISSTLQSNLFEDMKGEAGAVSAMNPLTGELLALVSFPSFDPNIMVTGMSVEKWNSYNDDPKFPFLNRFTSLYAPGSVFKAITASIGIDSGVTYPEKRRHINGLQWKKDSSWGGYYVTRVANASNVNLYDALALSDNIFFAQEALEMGYKMFESKAIQFGFQSDFNLPLYVPKSQLSNEGIHGEVLLADSSYGQGEVLMSLIHLGVAFTPFANSGQLIFPHLLLGEQNGHKERIISNNTAEVVNNALVQVAERRDGTAYSLHTLQDKIAAKTGTAELKKKKGENGLENGFLVAYDTESPNILIAAVVENVKGRGGSQVVINKVKPSLQTYLTFNH
ncbi:penicillin-binding protein PBP4(5) [Bacillus massiliigorillae]|uniref:penicillin-binding protein PBP4(5) n=1 Tax=Bacillus massiliigorillae TaxID=1243664 RepID=UPI00039A5850|nr:penicillin-binding transpeptidase domain-containing protein [Bacillus massiliigorillae]